MSADTLNAKLKVELRRIEALPAMPVIAQKMLALDLETDQGELMMLRLIEQDPQMAAKIIGLANAPLFGASKRVTSVTDAAMLLGMTRVKSVALGIAALSSLATKSPSKLDLAGFWVHSFAVALGAGVLARAMPRNERPLDSDVFLAGLLHDIGFMVLNQLDPEVSDRLHARLAEDSEHEAIDIENELLDTDHTRLGAVLAEHWHLPPAIMTVIRYHHTPAQPRAAKAAALTRLIHVAERLLPAGGFNENAAPDVDAGDWQALGVDLTRFDELSEQVRTQSDAAKALVASFG